MNSASKAHYTRAARALRKQPLAPLDDPQSIERLQPLYPKPKTPIRVIDEAELPPTPRITEASVRHAVHTMNLNSAPGSDRMQPSLLRTLATTDISPEEGVSALSTLTPLVARLAREDIPSATLPLIRASTLLPI